MMDNATSPPSVRELLLRYNLRPKKSLGQNFLSDPFYLHQVVQAAHLEEDTSVLEIGAGLGSLTWLLAHNARRVVAVEVDENLLPPLREVVAGFSNVQLVAQDILQINLRQVFAEDEPYCVVANIPYYITSAVIRRLMEGTPKPRHLTLTVQLEVAQRICAKAGEMSLLALSVQLYGSPLIAARIPRHAFYPVPQVDSAVLHVELYPRPRLAETEVFFRLAKAGFQQKRKTLRNSLAGGLGMKTADVNAILTLAGIDPFRRAETLTLDEWQTLVLAYQQFCRALDDKRPQPSEG